MAILVILLLWLAQKPGERPNAKAATNSVMVYCAAGLRKPVEQIAHDYEKEMGVRVQLSYGGSQVLLAGLAVSKVGDLFIPADESYLLTARAKGLVREEIPLARMHPMVCVRKGNPLQIRSIQDLLKGEVKLGQASPEAAAIGATVKKALTRSGQWEEIAAKTRVFKGTVNEVANDVKLGAIDAAFAWDAIIAQYPDLEGIALPELAQDRADVNVAVLESSQQPTEALRFARFLSARDRGLLVFAQDHYQVVAGDVWSETPSLRLLSGAMLRPAVEQTISDFERREGVTVSRVYNGCGILVAQMRAGERPDAYFACERSFMTQVNDLFVDREDVSRNQLVLLVAKGNPKNLHTLEDLGRPSLKIGVGHEKQSALGALTQNLLVKSGQYEAVRKNVTVESPTGDYLVNQLRTGSLDAVIVYRSNANTVRDKLDSIALMDGAAIAIQPVAIGRDSTHPQLTRRLVDALKSGPSKERFLAAGFEWELGQSSQSP